MMLEDVFVVIKQLSWEKVIKSRKKVVNNFVHMNINIMQMLEMYSKEG